MQFRCWIAACRSCSLTAARRCYRRRGRYCYGGRHHYCCDGTQHTATTPITATVPPTTKLLLPGIPTASATTHPTAGGADPRRRARIEEPATTLCL